MLKNKDKPADSRIDTRAFYRTVAALVVPMALQNLINVAVQSADVVMLGRVGEVVLSASSLGGQVQFVMMLILFGLGSGASVLTAQYWGKGDVRTIEKVMAISMRTAFVVALVFFTVSMAVPEALMRIFTPEEEIITHGAVYIRLLAPSFLLIAITNLYLTIMRSVERVIVSAIIYFISLIANVGLNALLIFGLWGFPALGIAGAAIATTTARVLETVLVFIYMARHPDVRPRLRDFFGHHKVLMRDFVKYAMPTTLNELLWGTAISATSVIIGHMGAAAVAANSVAQVTRQLAMVVGFGVANAAAIIIGKALGGGEPLKAEAYGGRLLRLSLFTGCAGCLLILAVRPLVLAMMNLSPRAEDYLGFLLLVMSFYVIAQTFCTCAIVGVFRGGGDPRFGLILDLIIMWFCTVLWAALAAFVFQWPVKVVYLFIMADEFIKTPICLIRYRSKRWLKNVTRSSFD